MDAEKVLAVFPRVETRSDAGWMVEAAASKKRSFSEDRWALCACTSYRYFVFFFLACFCSSVLDVSILRVVLAFSLIFSLSVFVLVLVYSLTQTRVEESLGKLHVWRELCWVISASW